MVVTVQCTASNQWSNTGRHTREGLSKAWSLLGRIPASHETRRNRLFAGYSDERAENAHRMLFLGTCECNIISMNTDNTLSGGVFFCSHNRRSILCLWIYGLDYHRDAAATATEWSVCLGSTNSQQTGLQPPLLLIVDKEQRHLPGYVLGLAACCTFVQLQLCRGFF